jgi:hypothetical protein
MCRDYTGDSIHIQKEIKMSRAHDLAWCAGFFDGEGFVCIQRRKMRRGDKEYESLYLRIGINHVNPEPLYEMQRIFGGNIRVQNPEKVIGNRKQRHSWSLSCQAAKDALVQMMPYFRNKQLVAELGIEFQNTMSDNKKKTPEETVAYRSLLKHKISEMNAKD